MLRSRSLVVSFVGLFAVGAIACGGSDTSDELFGKTGASGAGQGGGSAGKAGAAGGTQAGSSQGGAGTTGTGGAGSGGVSQGGAAGKAAGGGGGTAGGPVGGKAGAGGTGGKATGGAAGTAGKGGSAGVGGKAGASGTGGSKAGAAGVGGSTVGGSAGTGGGTAGGAAGAGGDPAGGAAGAGGDPAGGAAGAGGDPAGGAAGAGGDPAGGAAGAAGSGGGNPDKCPGSAVSVGPGPKVTIDGSTLTSGNDGRSQNGQCGGTSSNDVVFQVTPTSNGRLAIDNTTTFSGSIYARAACGDEASQIACDGNGSTQSITIDVQAGVPVWIYVDGFGQTNQAGGFQLSFELFECGDGVVQSGEDCDDGNAAAGDGCDAACKFEQNGPCELQNAEPNTRTMPRKAPAQCLTAAFLQPLGPQQGIGDNGADEDWYCIDVAEGQTLLAGTFQTAPDSCNLFGNHDTIVEIYKGTPSADPANTSCTGSTALVCDDNSGPDTCSIASYTVPAGEGGTYCARVIDNGKNGSIQFYNAYLAIR